MKVKIRHVDNGGDAIYFCDIPFGERENLIREIKQSGGVYCEGQVEQFHSYQYVLENDEMFLEVLIGGDDE
jgi:hypothetical protein